MFHHLLLKLSLTELTDVLESGTDLAGFLSELFTFLIGLAAVLSMLMIVYGGFLYMTAGATGKVNDAKEKIKNAILGLVLALSSYLILSFINPDLVELNLPSFDELDSIDNWSGWEVMLPTQDPDSPLPPLARCETDTRCSAGFQCCDEDGNCKDDFPGFEKLREEKFGSEASSTPWLPDSIIKQAVAAEEGKEEEEEEEETIYRCRSDEDMVVTGLNSECQVYSDCPDTRLTCYIGTCEPKKGKRQTCVPEPGKKHCRKGLSCQEHSVSGNICLPAGYQPGQEEDQEKEADTIPTQSWYHLDSNKIYLYRHIYKDIKVNQDNEVPRGYKRVGEVRDFRVVDEDKNFEICEEKVLEQVHKVLTWEGSLFSWTEEGDEGAILYRIPSGGNSCDSLGDMWEKTNNPICNISNKEENCCFKAIDAYNCYIKTEKEICQEQESKTAEMKDCNKHPEFSSDQRLPATCCRIPITENMAKSAEFVKNNLHGSCDNLILHDNAKSKIGVLTEAVKSLFSGDEGAVSFDHPIIKENLGGNSPTERILKGYTFGQVICGKKYMESL